ncbi:MAG: ribosome assembly RNA-binding protein YhbY [Gammaproteobacteria bacterium]|nr:ribosome assembly RNA-binding protein YhbY [Gammaproteobacteria bacterium]MDH5591413.1 ribosome assembly RNA-binding protein YhbY [Gammaproteobacteria bacterium]
MAVNDKQKRYLRGLAHSLKPIVMIGSKGLTDTVLSEIEIALERHELIKVRVSGLEKAERTEMLNEIANKTSSNLVMVIGHIGGFYRPAKEPTIQLPGKK